VRAAVELERRQADEARRRSEESYRSIFEAAEDPLFVHDAGSGAILDVNPKACQVYGYSREELLSLGVGALSSGVPPYTQERAAVLIEQARREGPVRMEWHRRNKDGSLHWDEVYIKLVKIPGRHPRDPRRQGRAEALRKSEDRLRATIEAALDCIIGVDEQGRIVEFNPAAEATFGYTKREALGQGSRISSSPSGCVRLTRPACVVTWRRESGAIWGAGRGDRPAVGRRRVSRRVGHRGRRRPRRPDFHRLSARHHRAPRNRWRTGSGLRASCARRRRWRPSASSPAASLTTSTICSPASWAT
jgi:PAS domain S-box-containing protein